jgi:hypothetical protein
MLEEIHSNNQYQFPRLYCSQLMMFLKKENWCIFHFIQNLNLLISAMKEELDSIESNKTWELGVTHSMSLLC